jgi:hypothetical protein
MNAVLTGERARSLARPVTFLSMVLGPTIVGCFDALPVTEPVSRLTPSQVTPALARSLTSDGRFILPASVVNPSGELTEGQAKAIAIRYVRDLAPSLGSSWSADHGADVQAKSLAPCDRALYAANPYSTLAGAKLSEITVRTFGPHWVVPMCGGARPQMVVSFSSLATELPTSVSANQLVPWERADIRSFGIPSGVPGSLFSPEGAAQRAFAVAGKRVRAIPSLIMNPMPASPVLVRWQVELEAPITVKGARSAVARDRSTLLVGYGETFKEAGLLDGNPQGEAAALSWTDAVTREPFTLVLAPRAVGSVELVTTEDQ